MSQALRKLTANIKRANTLVIFINQIRMKIGVMFGNPETTTGGNALKFYASVRLDIRRIGAIKRGDEVVGNETRVKVVKNKIAPPFREALFDILYGEGISRHGEIIELGVAHDIIEKSGAWYAYNGEKIGQGKDNTREFLREHPAMARRDRGEDPRGRRRAGPWCAAARGRAAGARRIGWRAAHRAARAPAESRCQARARSALLARRDVLARRSRVRSSPAIAAAPTADLAGSRRAARRAGGAAATCPTRDSRRQWSRAEERRLQQSVADRREPEGARASKAPAAGRCTRAASRSTTHATRMVALWRRRFGNAARERQGEGAAGSLPPEPRVFAVGDHQAAANAPADDPTSATRLVRGPGAPGYPRCGGGQGVTTVARAGSRVGGAAQSRVKSAALQRAPATR